MYIKAVLIMIRVDLMYNDKRIKDPLGHRDVNTIEVDEEMKTRKTGYD